MDNSIRYFITRNNLSNKQETALVKFEIKPIKKNPDDFVNFEEMKTPIYLPLKANFYYFIYAMQKKDPTKDWTPYEYKVEVKFFNESNKDYPTWLSVPLTEFEADIFNED